MNHLQLCEPQSFQSEHCVLPHGFEQSLAVVWERHEQFQLGASFLLN